MTLYLLYMILPLLIGMLFIAFGGRKARSSDKYLIVMGSVMFFFFACRSKYVGSGDAQFYYNLWERFSLVSFENLPGILAIDLEKGYIITTWALSHVFQSGQFVFVFAGILYAFTVCKFIKENIEDYILGFLAFNSLGIFSFFMQGIRQSIAICICLLVIKFCKERKLVKYLIMIFVATMFHASAAMFAVVYFIYGFKVNYKSIFIVGVLAVLTPYILRVVTNVANILMNESYVGGSTETTYGGTLTMIMYALIVVYSLLLHKEKGIDIEKEYVNFSFNLFMFIIATAFFATRFFYISIFERASYYFTFFSIPALEYTKNRYTERSRRYVEIAFIIAFAALAIYKSGPSATLHDYRFFWNEFM